jgi:heme o synthase
MLPVIVGGHETRRQILIYSILLAPAGMAPALFGFTSLAYLVVSAVGGAIMVYLAYDLYRIGDGEKARKASYRLFGTSILYLFGLFAALLIEKIVPLVPWAALLHGVIR